jgi:hypothetical protein
MQHEEYAINNSQRYSTEDDRTPGAVECTSPEEPAMSVRDAEMHRIVEQITASLPSDLTEEHRQQLSNVFIRHSHCLSLNEFDLGFTDLVEHTIDTENTDRLFAGNL